MPYDRILAVPVPGGANRLTQDSRWALVAYARSQDGGSVTSGHTPRDAESGLAEDPAVGLVDGTVPAESGDSSSGRHSLLSSDIADMIVSRLFEVGLVLQSADVGADGSTRLRLRKAAEDVDTLIRDVRSAIFGPAS